MYYKTITHWELLSDWSVYFTLFLGTITPPAQDVASASPIKKNRKRQNNKHRSGNYSNFSTIKNTPFWEILQKWRKITFWLKQVKKSTKKVIELVNHHNFEGNCGRFIIFLTEILLKVALNIHNSYLKYKKYSSV